MYTSTVFVIGTVLMGMFSIKPESIWMLDLPEAEQILQICEAIVIARSDERLQE